MQGTLGQHHATLLFCPYTLPPHDHLFKSLNKNPNTTLEERTTLLKLFLRLINKNKRD